MMLTSETVADRVSFDTMVEIGGYVDFASTLAVLEAERVLAETEAGTRGPVHTRYHAAMGCNGENCGCAALASALADIMPELDRLAREATADTANGQHARADYCATLWMRDRNRATLTGMEAR